MIQNQAIEGKCVLSSHLPNFLKKIVKARRNLFKTTSFLVSISDDSSSVVIEPEEIRRAFVFEFLLFSEARENRFVVQSQHGFRVITGQVNWIRPETKLNIHQNMDDGFFQKT